MTRRKLALALGLSCVTLLLAGQRVYPAESSASTAAEVFMRSARAYREAPALEDTLTMVVEIPGSEPGERVIRYKMGQGSDVELDIEGYLRLLAVGERLYVERFGQEEKYFETAFDGDFGKALAGLWDDSLVQGIVFRPAGLWEPPQVAMRAGKKLEAVLHALRYAPVLEALAIVDFEVLSDSIPEVRLEAENGSSTVRFDPETYFITEVEYEIRPAGAPEGYTIEARGRYSPRVLAAADGVVGFEPGDRTAVDTLRGLRSPLPGIARPPAEVLPVERIEKNLLDVEELASRIGGKRVLLIGEDHLFKEPVIYATTLMDAFGDRPVSLLLELPAAIQPAIDHYLEECTEPALASVFEGQLVLALQDLLRWACNHPERARAVKAMDENMLDILLKRLFLTDTRNETMARAIVSEYEDDPDTLVVAYAGQLHMTQAGRYRYNQPDREPAGSRIHRMGVPDGEIVGIMLNGGDKFHLHEVWKSPGALPMEGAAASIPYAYFIDYPIFGVKEASELFDYFVNLGSLTPVQTE
ncbi:MAG: hypothetical protein EP299_07145 [Acidobacteria bacterium]|nr:MAG: hypothetical protein EP299_07145 [Acidobacteriota bacterium]